MKSKPICHYDAKAEHHIKIGESAWVKPVDHPNPHGLVSNTKHVQTSEVITVLDDGKFETLNTIYEPL